LRSFPRIAYVRAVRAAGGQRSDLLTGLHGMEQIEAPPRLVYSILDKTLGPRET